MLSCCILKKLTYHSNSGWCCVLQLSWPVCDVESLMPVSRHLSCNELVQSSKHCGCCIVQYLWQAHPTDLQSLGRPATVLHCTAVLLQVSSKPQLHPYHTCRIFLLGSNLQIQLKDGDLDFIFCLILKMYSASLQKHKPFSLEIILTFVENFFPVNYFFPLKTLSTLLFFIKTIIFYRKTCLLWFTKMHICLDVFKGKLFIPSY